MGILGHTQLATTMDLYSHTLEDAKQEAAARLHAALGAVAEGVD